ncbi:hypothetical protein JM18_000058 [Phytophthora kernoviae]|uniref:Uncharacterized protein n=2 Tax=Phytophthora kernoviae TaxID=325452 RepID=A0A921VGI6_9STRA|nr:hypothetical protein G195_000818 [Phytophthora kernoviae 00238/432]KAG2533605.1 hypothetical protein JM18_000058 [Phytophthora kernoviae]
MSFSKSDRFLSQKVSMSGTSHQRELIAAESPGPKYNVDYMSSNGGKTVQPKFSFAAPSSPKSQKTRLPEVGPRRGHRESWMSVINRNGVLVMPASPARPRQAAKDSTATSEQARSEDPAHIPSNNASGKNSGNMFGHEHRFGKRQTDAPNPVASLVSNTRVQFVSATHTRENMGEFSPGPIYAPYNPERPGGRLAPAAHRPVPPSSPSGTKYPHANPSSRSSWLAGAVRKCDGQETVLLRVGDVPPGPGSYAGPPSSFIKVSHNVKTKPNPMMVRITKLCFFRCFAPNG